MFTIFSQQILSSRLLLAVIGGQKSNLSNGFKLEPKMTYHLGFVFTYQKKKKKKNLKFNFGSQNFFFFFPNNY